MTELEYLLLADSTYLDLAVKQNLSTAVNKASYEDRNRKDAILKTMKSTTKLDNVRVVAARSMSNGLYAVASTV